MKILIISLLVSIKVYSITPMELKKFSPMVQNYLMPFMNRPTASLLSIQVGEDLESLVKFINESTLKKKGPDSTLSTIIINQMIPELLFCSFGLAVPDENSGRENKLYYYPTDRDLSLGKKVKRVLGVRLFQKINKISRTFANLNPSEAKKYPLESKILDLIDSMDKGLQLGARWDMILYRINCYAGALNHSGKRYSVDLGKILKYNFKTALDQMMSSKFSCLNITNIAMFLAESIYLEKDSLFKDDIKNTKGKGNAGHAYIESISARPFINKIYIDPYVFYDSFEAFRDIKLPFEDYQQILLSRYNPPGIAYEVDATNFRGVDTDTKSNRIPCNAKIELREVGSPRWVEPIAKNLDSALSTLDFNKNCEGQIFAMSWNTLAKGRQAAMFSLLIRDGKLIPYVLPTWNSTGNVLGSWIGYLNTKLEDFIIQNFKKEKITESDFFKLEKIENYNDYKKFDIGNFSSFRPK